MPYQPSRWGQTAEDKRGEFAMAGGKALADGIGQVGNAFSSAIAETIGNREKSVALDASMSIIQQQAPNLLPPDFMEKFHGAGVSAKSGMMTTALAMLSRQDQQGQQGQDFGLRQSADRRAWAQANYNMDPASKLPQSYTTPGGGRAIVTANGAVEPESNFLPEQAAGEWRPMPGNPGYLGHWTPGKGFTGAQVPNRGAGATGPLPNLTFVEDPATGMGAYLDANGDVVDPSKLARVKTTAPAVPPWNIDIGTGKPLAMTPGAPGRKEVEFAGTAAPTGRTRTYVHPDTKQTIREWPDGRTEYLSFPNEGNAAAGQIPEWLPIAPGSEGPSSNLFPPVPGAPVPAGPAKPAPAKAAPRWR